MLHEITGCEVCGAKTLTSVLDLGEHPLCDDLVPLGDTRVCKEYPIEILYCSQCVTAHQRFQVPKRELFPTNYHYRARHTADVLRGMRELVESCEETFGALAGKKILDIGCDDGSLLSFFAEKGAQTYGIEPTEAFQDAAENGHKVLNKFFDSAVAKDFVAQFGHPDVITFTNVFAHIENLADLVEALKIVKHEGTAIVIENHYMGAVLDKFQFDTFYHEHPRTYSFTSFTYIAGSLGMSVGHASFPSRYNGNIRVVLTPQSGASIPAAWDQLKQKEQGFGAAFHDMARKLDPWKNKKRAEIQAAAEKHGPIVGKAFPGRAAIPIKMLGIDVDFLKAVYEKPQSGKIGHYIPGTRIPILSDDDFDAPRERGPLLNLAWHIASEIRSYLAGKGYRGTYIELIAPEDIS